MKKLHKFLALAALTPFLAACTPSNEDLCNHVMDLLKKEMGDAKDAPQPSDEELKKFTEECVKDIDKQKEKLGEDKFKEMAKCTMAAQSMDDMMKCDKGGDEEEKKAE